jgi:hypothetical protein
MALTGRSPYLYPILLGRQAPFDGDAQAFVPVVWPANLPGNGALPHRGQSQTCYTRVRRFEAQGPKQFCNNHQP